MAQPRQAFLKAARLLGRWAREKDSPEDRERHQKAERRMRQMANLRSQSPNPQKWESKR